MISIASKTFSSASGERKGPEGPLTCPFFTEGAFRHNGEIVEPPKPVCYPGFAIGLAHVNFDGNKT